MRKIFQNPKFLFVTIGIASLGIISLTDRFIYNFLIRFESPLALLADLRITSLMLVFSIYFALKRMNILKDSNQKPVEKNAFLVPIIWLIMTGYFVLVQKVWVPSLKDWIDWTAFLVTGLVAEEILFRGVLFDLGVRVFGSRKIFNLSFPVLVTSFLFGLQHLSYHNFQIHSASVTQVLYTTMMGIVFAKFREAIGSLWPVIFLHLMNNFFTVIRNLI